MKTSAPAPASADKFRPTALPGGLEEARILDQGVVNWGFGFGSSHGLGGGLEGRWASGLTLGGAGVQFNPTVSSKYMVMKSGNMTVAAGGAAGIRLDTSIATPFDFSVGAMAPISFWKLGPGNLHVVPALQIPRFLAPTAFASPLSFLSVTAGYAYPFTPKVTLVAMDTLNLGLVNTLSLGGRIDFSDSLFIDIVPVSLTGATFTLSTLSVGATFGTNLNDLIKGLSP